MFLATDEPPALTEAGLRGLCVSLNTPVVNLEEMQVGPARSAIAVYCDAEGGLRLAVVIRSLGSGGQVQVFAYPSALPPNATPAHAMEGALPFAESMGFLFDEDLLAGGGDSGRSRALAVWRELVGEGARDDTQPLAALGVPEPVDLAPDLPTPDDTAPLGPDGMGLPREDELLLDEELEAFGLSSDDLDADLGEELAYSPEDLDADLRLTPEDLSLAGEDPYQTAKGRQALQPEARDADASMGAGVSLSKFRGPLPTDGEERSMSEKKSQTPLPRASRPPSQDTPEDSSSSELGRIPIVQLRLGGGEGPSLLAKLLGCF